MLKNKVLKGSLLAILIVASLQLSAQFTGGGGTPGGGGGGGGTPPTGGGPVVPFDGGMSLMLLASGVGYATKQFMERRG